MMSIQSQRWFTFLRAAALLCVGVTVMGCAGSARTFQSPDEAADAFVAALRTGDDAQLRKIFGPDARDFLHSGDDIADQQRRAAFLDKCEESRRFVDGGDGSLTLLVGADDWPFAVPLAPAGNGWRFDSAAGRDELLSRRIGANELAAIETCLACIDAQIDYAMRDPDGDGVRAFALRFFSTPGTHDGLYWPTSDDETPSPLGALVAEAAAAGYDTSAPDETPRPYHGYIFRLLRAQGPDASGGEMSYEVGGRLISGFALIARPASYERSGVMTFIANHEGLVYEKDLGPDTPTVADAMTAFNPDDSWRAANDAPFESVWNP